jgi:hypothetical protein
MSGRKPESDSGCPLPAAFAVLNFELRKYLTQHSKLSVSCLLLPFAFKK